MAYEKLRITHLQCSKQARCDPVITKSRKKERERKKYARQNIMRYPQSINVIFIRLLFKSVIWMITTIDTEYSKRWQKHKHAKYTLIQGHSFLFHHSNRSKMYQGKEKAPRTNTLHTNWYEPVAVVCTQRKEQRSSNWIYCTLTLALILLQIFNPGEVLWWTKSKIEKKLKKKNSSNEKKNTEQKRNREIPSEIVYTIFFLVDGALYYIIRMDRLSSSQKMATSRYLSMLPYLWNFTISIVIV